METKKSHSYHKRRFPLPPHSVISRVRGIFAPIENTQPRTVGIECSWNRESSVLLGVLLKTLVTEPAQSTSTSPPGCFTLKLGTKVRGSYGEGVVLAAQCTPGRLTQYRIENRTGTTFGRSAMN